MRYLRLLLIAILCFVGVGFSASTVNPQGDGSPIPISSVRPPYPPVAYMKKISGTVLVDVKVNSEGKVVEANAIMGHEALRHSAEMAAWGWLFKPFKVKGNSYSVRLTFIFHDDSYVAPEKKPDFTSPYQVEIERPVLQY